MWTYLCPDSHSCLVWISPWGTGVMGVSLLISLKSWHKHHFLGDAAMGLSSDGGGRGGRSKAASKPYFMHSSFTLCFNSLEERPVFSCTL